MSGSHDIQSYSRRLQSPTRAERYATRFDRGSRQRIDLREQRAVRRIFSELKDCRSVLDVPCGAGRFLATLAQGGRTVLEMDVALEILTFAQKAAVNAKITAFPMQGDASRLPLQSASVDCVFSNRLLHHILPSAERIAVLQEFHRVTRRWAVVSFFNYKSLGMIRGLLKRLKGRTPPYENQPTLKQFSDESVQSGFCVKTVMPIGPPWVSQRYFVLEKT